MEALTLATLAALVVKIMTVVKAFGKDWNLVITQAVAWAVGVATSFLAAHSKITSDLVVFGTTKLADLDASSLLLIGMSLASSGSFLYDYKKARDNTDSAAEPSLTGPTTTPPAN